MSDNNPHLTTMLLGKRALFPGFQKPNAPILLWLGAIFVFVALPFIALFLLSFSGFDVPLWSHLNNTILWPIAWNTAVLLLWVGVLVTLMGVATAWLVTMCAFPGRGLFSFALLLPLALPTYVSAFAYIEFLGFTGPLQSFIRDIFGFQSLQDYWFPQYRNLGGAAVVMSLVLYPYVYLTARASFTMQTAAALDASRTLGAGPWKLFFRVALPIARPAIIVGTSLALLETANDIGAVEFFGVRTLTTMIYDVWLNRSSLSTAVQMANLFLILVVLLLWLERHARRAQRLYQSVGKNQRFQPFQLSPMQQFLAFLVCALPIVFGFLIPVAVLMDSALAYVIVEGVETLLMPASNTLLLAILATFVTVLIGFFLAYLTHGFPNPLIQIVVRLGTLGYAIPGVVLAIGILIPLAAFDNTLDGLMRSVFDIKTGLLLSGTMVALIYAYAIRFLSMAYGACDNGFQRLSPNFGHAARLLGRSETQTLHQIYVPLLRPALLTGALLVFVDCMKELPATLLLRPFNFDTLATRIYDSASLEIFEQGALPALAIVIVGIIPVILLSKQMK